MDNFDNYSPNLSTLESILKARLNLEKKDDTSKTPYAMPTIVIQMKETKAQPSVTCLPSLNSLGLLALL